MHDRFFFLHIPKTAGMSLHQLLLEHVAGPYLHLRYPHQSRWSTPAIWTRFRGCGGHMRWSEAHQRGFLRGFNLTFLRDPIERVLSQYSFSQQADDGYTTGFGFGPTTRAKGTLVTDQRPVRVVLECSDHLIERIKRKGKQVPSGIWNPRWKIWKSSILWAQTEITFRRCPPILRSCWVGIQIMQIPLGKPNSTKDFSKRKLNEETIAVFGGNAISGSGSLCAGQTARGPLESQCLLCAKVLELI